MGENLTYYHMSFDNLWEYARRNKDNYEVLSDLDYFINMCSYSTSPFGLFNSAPIDKYNQTVSYVNRISYNDLELVFKAWCTNIEGSFSKMQTYIQAKVSYDDHSSNLNQDWDDEWDKIQAHNTSDWFQTLRNVLRFQSRNFYEQLAKFGIVFLAASKTSFTSKQYRYLKTLYSTGNLL